MIANCKTLVYFKATSTSSTTATTTNATMMMILLFVGIITRFTTGSSAGDFGYRIVELGICENVQTGEKRCAMQASDCEFDHYIGEMLVHGEMFYSAHQQKQLRFPETCSCQHTFVGSCNNRCSPQRYGYCFMNESFREHFVLESTAADGGGGGGVDPNDANVATSSSCTCQDAHYGACQNAVTGEFFCAFSPNDCVADGVHVWIHPEDTQKVLGLVCTCDKVRVGGCVGERGQRFACAVTSDDCLKDEHYQTPYTLKWTHGRMCNLCERLSSDGDSLTLYEDELTNVSNKGQGRPSGLSRVGKTFLSLFVIGAMVGMAMFLFAKQLRKKSEIYRSSYWTFLRKNRKEYQVPSYGRDKDDQMFPCIMTKNSDVEII